MARPPDSFIPLKTNWFHILLALGGEEQHGYGIMQEVLERTDGKVRLWPATLYGAIRDLQEEDLIAESRRRPAEDDDPRRRYYRITPLGRRVLAAEGVRLRQLVKFLDRVQEASDEANHSRHVSMDRTSVPGDVSPCAWR